MSFYPCFLVPTVRTYLPLWGICHVSRGHAREWCPGWVRCRRYRCSVWGSVDKSFYGSSRWHPRSARIPQECPRIRKRNESTTGRVHWSSRYLRTGLAQPLPKLTTPTCQPAEFIMGPPLEWQSQMDSLYKKFPQGLTYRLGNCPFLQLPFCTVEE